MKESKIEAKYCKKVKEAGGIAFKFTSPGQSGVPDRLILEAGGIIRFVEFKSEKGKLSEIQKYQIERIRALGFVVEIVQE